MLRKQICLVTILMAFGLCSSSLAGYVDIPIGWDNTADQKNAKPLASINSFANIYSEKL